MANAAAEPWGWESYFTQLATFIQSSERQYESHANQQYAEYATDRLAVCWRNVLVVRARMASSAEQNASNDVERHALISLLTLLNELLQLLSRLFEQWQHYVNDLEAHVTSYRYRIPLLHSTCIAPGRPRFHITREQLEYLRSLSFSWTNICRILGVSRMTIYRRRAEYEMLSEPSQPVSHDRLSQIIQDLRRELPDIGQSMVAGRLRAMGIQVSRERIRETIRRTDPLNTALRWHGVTSRRPYSVPGPTLYGILVCACVCLHGQSK